MKFTNANSFKGKIKEIAKQKRSPSSTGATAIFT